MQQSSLNKWALIMVSLAIASLVATMYFAVNISGNSNTVISQTQTAEAETRTFANSSTELVTVVTQMTSAAATAASPPTTPDIAPTGIYDDEMHKAQWYNFGFKVENAWFGIVNGNLVTVFAGAYISDPEQGTLHVNMITPAGPFDGKFTTLEKNGALSVTTEQNNRLTLITTNGTTYYFDVPAMRFVSSLDEIVPTATPLPTQTPFIIPTEITLTGYPPPLPSAASTEGYPAPTAQATAVP